MRLPRILVIVVAVSGCARGQVERPDTPSVYRSPRHVIVVVTRGGRTVHVGGQGPFDRQGALVGRGDFPLQVETAFQNLEAALAAHALPVSVPEGPDPYRFADAGESRRALEAAGFAALAVETVTAPWRTATADLLF